jgi:hypothetical protein
MSDAKREASLLFVREDAVDVTAIVQPLSTGRRNTEPAAEPRLTLIVRQEKFFNRKLGSLLGNGY